MHVVLSLGGEAVPLIWGAHSQWCATPLGSTKYEYWYWYHTRGRLQVIDAEIRTICNRHGHVFLLIRRKKAESILAEYCGLIV